MSRLLSYTDDRDPFLRRKVIAGLERLTGRKRLLRLYNELRAEAPEGSLVWDRLLEKLEIGVEANWDALDRLSSEGPLIVIANHPFGVVDGIILGQLLGRLRSEYKILVNEVLYREPLINKFLLPIDFREDRAAMETNLSTRKKALELLATGQGAIGIFPAGGVATAVKPFGPVRDLSWKRFTAQMIQRSGATVLPLLFHGRNSPAFQLASHVHSHLRLGLLINEIRNKRGKTIKLTIGHPIPPEKMAAIKGRQELVEFLRRETFKRWPKGE
ncbi:MAG: lysophospholipid acyltransferase family protein [Bacteroidota bacterium]